MPTNPDSLDIVQVVKQEWQSLGGDAGDEAPYSTPIEVAEDAIEVAAVLLQEVGRRDKSAAIWPDSGKLRFRDSENTGSGKTLTELVSGSGGLTESSHEALDTLTHAIAETSYEEVTYSANKISAITVWETDSKLKKIREELYTYTGSKITQIVTNQYDGAGVVSQTVTETVTYDGVKIASIDRVKS